MRGAAGRVRRVVRCGAARCAQADTDALRQLQARQAAFQERAANLTQQVRECAPPGRAAKGEA